GAGPGSTAWGNRRPPRSYGHLEGDVRWRRLFSATRFFLRIDGGGGVEGTRWRERPGSEWGWNRERGWHRHRGEPGSLRRASPSPGTAGAGHGTGGMDGIRGGRREGGGPGCGGRDPTEFNPNCKFTERIEENGYNTYASLRWRHQGRPMFLSLNSKGRPQRGGKTRRQHLSTHFLPMLVS
ncbi:FGF22 factor, partial [Centropus bengalensis]|nr:FGF22 factor [Centropus bengalensis]